MLTERDKTIVDLFARKVRERYPEARIWAFGSRARGDHDEESDLDLCVVLDCMDKTASRAIVDIAWEVGFENDLLIAPVIFDTKTFMIFPGDANPLVQSILEEGIAA